MPSRRPKILGTLALAIALGAARPSVASPLFELTGGMTGQGGFNARTTGAGPSSTYFNPALLPDSSEELDVGLMVVSDQIGMTLDGRTGGIVPLVVGDRQIVDRNGNPISNATVPTDWLQHGCKVSQCGSPPFAARPRQAAGSSGNTRAYTVLGLVTRLVEDRLVLGLYALVPTSEFTEAHSFYNDEREQFFTNSLHPELYSDRLTATSLSFGAGSRLTKQLSVGASFTLSLTNDAAAQTYVRDPIAYDKLLLSTDVHVNTDVSPHFGVEYTPLDWLHLTATAHSVQRFQIDTAVSAALPSGNESGTQRKAVHSFLPWTFAVGGSADLNRGSPNEFALAGTLKYALWSTYLDRHGESPESGCSGDPNADCSRFAWSNTVSAALGLRHRSHKIRSFLDFEYEPTPVPPQTGRKNYVDNDSLGVAVGGDYQFAVFDLPIRVGLSLQAHRLIPRHQTKDDALIADELPDDARDARTGKPIPGSQGLQTNNPGWPGFASEGWILGGALTLALIY